MTRSKTPLKLVAFDAARYLDRAYGRRYLADDE